MISKKVSAFILKIVWLYNSNSHCLPCWLVVSEELSELNNGFPSSIKKKSTLNGGSRWYRPWSLHNTGNALVFPGCGSDKEVTCQCRIHKRHSFSLWVRKILGRRTWQSTSVFLTGEFHRQRSLAGVSPWSHRVGHDWSYLTHTHENIYRKTV